MEGEGGENGRRTGPEGEDTEGCNSLVVCLLRCKDQGFLPKRHPCRRPHPCPPPALTCTISSASHSVPEPFLSTSSGGMGMMVEREKMKGCTYVMYR